jgi:DNA-binding transcriptional ArsR family regulator
MPRAPTTLDAFNAIAEPKRREVLAAIANRGGDTAVNDLVETLGWPQPQVSKHLAVLREVGLVAVRREGRERRYSVIGAQLKTIHDWTAMFERFWQSQLDRIKAKAEAKARSSSPWPKPAEPKHRETN